MGGGAWPFLVGGVICLVNSDNERDSVLLNSWIVLRAIKILLQEGTEASLTGSYPGSDTRGLVAAIPRKKKFPKPVFITAK